MFALTFLAIALLGQAQDVQPAATIELTAHKGAPLVASNAAEPPHDAEGTREVTLAWGEPLPFHLKTTFHKVTERYKADRRDGGDKLPFVLCARAADGTGTLLTSYPTDPLFCGTYGGGPAPREAGDQYDTWSYVVGTMGAQVSPATTSYFLEPGAYTVTAYLLDGAEQQELSQRYYEERKQAVREGREIDHASFVDLLVDHGVASSPLAVTITTPALGDEALWSNCVHARIIGKYLGWASGVRDEGLLVGWNQLDTAIQSKVAKSPGLSWVAREIERAGGEVPN